MQQSNVSLETSNTPNAQDASASSAKPSRNAAKSVEGQQPPTEEPKKKPLSLADIFAGDESDDEIESDEDDPTKTIDSIDRLMKRTKLTAEQLYAIKIPMRDGQEPVTLGKLKDMAASVGELDEREIQFDQRRTRQEGELIRAQQEMRDVLSLLPKEHLTPALIKKVRAQHEAHVMHEQELTLEHIPDWHDEKTRLADIKGMNKFLSKWGFNDAFLATIVDHRAIKFVRDMFLMDQKIQKALAAVQTPDKKGMKPSPKSKAARSPGTESPRQKGPPVTGANRLSRMFRS